MDDLEIMVAVLSRVVKGETVNTVISASGDALVSVQDQLVEGASMRLYGEIHADCVKVIGPDLTKRTLAR